MKTLCAFVALWLGLAAVAFAGSANAARTFLSYLYGAEPENLAAICHPHDDLWMLQGAPNPAGQRAVAAEDLKVADTGVFAGLIERDFCVVELRDGKVDPRFNLESIYTSHRQLVLQFLYFSLLQEKDELARLATDANKLSFGGVKAASYGDMDVYEGLLALVPVVRVSDPAADRASRSITYRVPLGPSGFSLKLVRAGNSWKVDTSTKVTVPLEMFWE